MITLTYENDLTVKVFQIDADDDDYSVINKKITKIDST